MPSPAMVDPAKLNRRRVLHFNTLDDALAETDKLEAAHNRGELTCAGNWSPGQSLGHLAAWVDYGFDGVPMKVPFFVPWIMKLLKARMLYKPMRSAVRIPRVSGGTLGIAPMSIDDGLAAFRRTYTRLKTESPSLPHILFGPMTKQEWTELNLRHAELHLSFMDTGNPAQ